MSSTVEKIKEKLSITDVVSSYIKLERAGSNLKACCPFHNEKTPSFFVSPGRETFHCFGCEKGGDIFNFVQDIEGVDFFESLKVLAERAGIEVEQLNSPELQEKEKLLNAMEAATQYFEKNIENNNRILEYLHKRGLRDETIIDFRIGFVPDDWRGLFAHLGKEGFTPAHIIKSGLAISSRGSTYDRFRGRILFPIADPSGKVIALSGRIDPDLEEKDDGSHLPRKASEGVAKYINSPETILFNKSKTLYGYDKAKMAIRKKDVCVLVEGQMDVVMSHQSGIINTVAVSGTALTHDHLTLIKRMTENIIIAFDSDEAGIVASGRGIDIALSHGFNVKLPDIANGVDPADIMKDDPEKWKAFLKNAKHVVDFYLVALKEIAKDERDYQKQVETKVIPYVAQIRSKIEQAHFVSRVAQSLGLGEDPVWETLRRCEKESPYNNRYTNTKNRKDEKNDDFPFESREKYLIDRIVGLVLLQRSQKDSHVDISYVEKEFYKLINESIDDTIKKISKEDVQKIIFETEIHHDDSEIINRELKEVFLNLKEHILKGRLIKTMNDLKYAEEKKDDVLASESLKRCNELSQEINVLTFSRMSGESN